MAEKHLWELIRKDQILNIRFRRQHKIGPYIVDFYSIKIRLAIEADGEIHTLQTEQDEERTKWLKSMGIRVLRFPNEEILTRPEIVRKQIELAVSEQLH